MAGREDRLPLEFLVHAGQNPEQRTLPGPVEAQDADLGAVEIGQVDVLENRSAVVIFADSDHRVDDLVDIAAHR